MFAAPRFGEFFTRSKDWKENDFAPGFLLL
jgi:hypothetical protein